MTAVPVIGVVKTGTGKMDSRAWSAWSPVYRRGTNGEVITTRGKEFPVRVTAGQFSAMLEPGVVVLENPDGKQWTVTVPEEGGDLWEIIATSIAFPPDTSAEALASAVSTYLEENPVVEVPVEGITGAGAAGRDVLLAETAAEVLTAAGATEAGVTVVTGTQAQALAVLGAAPAQRARYGARTVGDGDSVMLGATVFGSWNEGRGGWIAELVRLSNGRIDLVHNAAVAGTGIDTRLANFDAQVAAFAPETVILANGTNNVASMPLSDYLAKLTQYYGLVRGIGAQLILGGIYPKSTDVATISTWNAALVEWAKSRGVIVIPFWELADPATGGWPAGWSSDGTHPLRESRAFAALGALAWQTLSRAYTEPVAPTARYVGEGIYTNFFTDLTATITGAATITAIASTTGTLPAGTYTYRVVPRNYLGKNTNYADSTITLASAGGVTLTAGGSGTYNRRAVYRKGPRDKRFKYIGQITATGSQTFTDNGITAGYDWVDGDSSRIPVGLANGSTSDLRTLQYGAPIRPGGVGDGIRGNILRLCRLEGAASGRIDRFTITGLTAGSKITVSFKCRGPNTTAAAERVALYFRDPADSTDIDVVAVIYHRLSSRWGLVTYQATVPAGSDRVRLTFMGDATSPWLDVAELRVAQGN